MKCPKCHYLGFETGDRCKHCGYDFSLLGVTDADPHGDLMLRPAPDADAPPDAALRDPDAADGPGASDDTAWLDREFDRALGRSAHKSPADKDVFIDSIDDSSSALQMAAAAGAGAGVARAPGAATSPRARVEPPLPLFSRAAAPDDEPLIRVPAAPRPPLSVRRTPDTPRVKIPAAALVRRREEEPELEFPDQLSSSPVIVSHSRAAQRVEPRVQLAAAGAVPRAVAALIDLAILFAIDLAVVYFTLRMAGLTMDDWRLLPLPPMLAFLMVVKITYYSAFTAVGGQTIGKMATHLRVVSEDDADVQASVAVQRTLAAIASVLTLGGAFAPALLSVSKRAFHDRVARTRVVTLPPV